MQINLIYPEKPLNKLNLWQDFLMYHNLRGKGPFPDSVYETYGKWLEELHNRNLIFEPFQFMPISPNNSGYNL